MGALPPHFDPDGDRLVRLAESLGGAEFMSRGERERLEITLQARDRRARLAAETTQRVDALALHERRLADLEAAVAWLNGMPDGLIWPVLSELMAEEIRRSDGETQRRVDELRVETVQKADAQTSGLEAAVRQVRDTDRALLLADSRSGLAEAEARIDTKLEHALAKAWERVELEIALVRDELLQVISEKAFGTFRDDGPKLELAEKAIAALRRRMTTVEQVSARVSGMDAQIAAMGEQIAAHQKARKGWVIRAAATAVTLKAERETTKVLGEKVAALESTLEELVTVLRENKTI